MLDLLRYSINNDSIHVIVVEENPYFKARAVIASLEYANTKEALANNVCKDDRKKSQELVEHVYCSFGYNENKPHLYQCSRSCCFDFGS